MTDTNRPSIERWTSVKANSLAAVCLLLGIAGGWFIRGSQSTPIANSVRSSNVPGLSAAGSSPVSQATTPARLKEMADAQAEPLLDQLKSDAANPDLLASIGNIYYDAQQYPIAVDYYGRALKANPADAAVRTDMGTAYWYMGNADRAIAEFEKALTYQPNKSSTLFNLGLVKWQGKKDSVSAVAAWEKLLATNPNYEEKGKVKEMIVEAKGKGK